MRYPAALSRRSGAAARTTTKQPRDPDFLRNAYADIPAAVQALRQYSMPIRYARARCPAHVGAHAGYN